VPSHQAITKLYVCVANNCNEQETFQNCQTHFNAQKDKKYSITTQCRKSVNSQRKLTDVSTSISLG